VEIGFGTILHRLEFWVHFLPIFRSSKFLVHRGYFNRWRLVFLYVRRNLIGSNLTVGIYLVFLYLLVSLAS
jgi:hypothetical protein